MLRMYIVCTLLVFCQAENLSGEQNPDQSKQDQTGSADRTNLIPQCNAAILRILLRHARKSLLIGCKIVFFMRARPQPRCHLKWHWHGKILEGQSYQSWANHLLATRCHKMVTPPFPKLDQVRLSESWHVWSSPWPPHVLSEKFASHDWKWVRLSASQGL